MKKSELAALTISKGCDVARSLFAWGTIFFLGQEAIEAFKVVALNSPNQVVALAAVVEALHISTWLPTVVAIGSVTAWRVERNGKKRAIKLAGEFRRQIEAFDPSRSSSELTPSGDTPVEVL